MRRKFNLTPFFQDAVTDAGSNTTTTLFDSHGNVTGVEDPRGNITGYHFDSFGRQDATIDGLGNRTTSIYDGYGQVTIAEDSLGNEINYVFDAAGRATVTVTPDNLRATTFYDAAGNVTGMKDTAGNLTQYKVDALGRTTVTIDANGDRTTQMFDAAGNMTSIKDASNNVSTFAYDALNRKISETDANGHTATFAYNAVGLMTSTTDRLGRRDDYQYDALNRLTTVIWHDSGGSATETMTYSYDANSNLLTAANSAGTYTMSYDALNRVTVANDVWGHTLTMSYDAAGNQTVVQDSLSGTTTSTYDAANQLTQREFNDGTTALHLDLTYTDAGQVESMRRYSGTTSPYPMAALTSFSYDAEGRIDNLDHTNGTGGNIANLTYTFDNAGNVQTEVLDGVTTTYTYDAAKQLTGDGTATFTYDGTGNRTNTGYTTGTGNELTGDGTWTYTYDAEGDRTKKTDTSTGETWTYGYDNRNQMIWAEDRSTDGGTLISRADYTYDVFGNRIEKQLDTDGNGSVDYTEKYAYDGWQGGMSPVVGQGFADNSNWNIWLDTDGSDALRERYIRGDAVDELFARVGSGAVALWELTDRLGSVRDVIDNTGAVKDAIQYDGWGNIISESASTFRGRYTWTGREYDTETQLQYNRARYYDPAVGRWTTRDPLGFDAGDSNVYRYVKNQPSADDDPSGLDRESQFLIWGIISFEVKLQNPGILLYGSRKSVKTGFVYVYQNPLKGLENNKVFQIKRPTRDLDLQKPVELSIGYGAFAEGKFLPFGSKLARWDFYWYQQIKLTTTYKDINDDALEAMLKSESFNWKDDVDKATFGFKNPYGYQYTDIDPKNGNQRIISMEDFPGVQWRIPAAIRGKNVIVGTTCKQKLVDVNRKAKGTITRRFDFRTRIVRTPTGRKNEMYDVGKEFLWGVTVESDRQGNRAFFGPGQKLRVAP